MRIERVQRRNADEKERKKRRRGARFQIQWNSKRFGRK